MTGLIDATRRRLFVAAILATLLALAIVIGSLARGGVANSPRLRAAAVLLDGHWRFHVGDDPVWADPRTDDSMGDDRPDRPTRQPRR